MDKIPGNFRNKGERQKVATMFNAVADETFNDKKAEDGDAILPMEWVIK